MTKTYQAIARGLIPTYELQAENAQRRTVDSAPVPVNNQLGDWMNYGDFPTEKEARSALSTARAQGKATRILYGDPNVAGGKKTVGETSLRQVTYEATDVVGR